MLRRTKLLLLVIKSPRVDLSSKVYGKNMAHIKMVDLYGDKYTLKVKLHKYG